MLPVENPERSLVKKLKNQARLTKGIICFLPHKNGFYRNSNIFFLTLAQEFKSHRWRAWDNDQGLCDMQQVRFNELPLTDKALLIAEFGKYLESIEFYDYWIHLYSLHSNFIEIYYNIHTRQIDKISLANYCDLDKYLNRIVVHGIRCR